jgi:hypothetical protein
MNNVRELNCLELEAVSAGMDKSAPTPPASVTAASTAGNSTEGKSEFIAAVVAWKRRVGMPVLIPGY